jgi:hypothetical protein
MKIDALEFVLDDLPNITIKAIEKYQYFSDQWKNSSYLFLHFFDELLTGWDFDFQKFRHSILSNVKQHAKKFISGESVSQQDWINSPWHFLNPVKNHFALWKLSEKDIMDNGYVVFCRQKDQWCRVFYDYNLNDPQHAAERISSMLDISHAVAINLRKLRDIVIELRLEKDLTKKYTYHYNMRKPTLHLQKNLFWEEENNPEYLSTIQKYFTTVILDSSDLLKKKMIVHFFRGSLAMSRRFCYNFDYTNCLNWVPVFRDYILDQHSYFNELGYYDKYGNVFPLFLRPVDGYKTFAGQVFKNYNQFRDEYRYLKQNKNVEDSLMCMESKVFEISREWRTVYIGNEYVDGGLYMQGNGIVEVEKSIPDEVVALSKQIAEHEYFLNVPNFVIDICESSGILRLLEINSFECSSFYGMDLNKIYKKLAENSENNVRHN